MSSPKLPRRTASLCRPNQQQLYVADVKTNVVKVHDIASDGRLGAGRDFASLRVDGLKTDEAGQCLDGLPRWHLCPRFRRAGTRNHQNTGGSQQLLLGRRVPWALHHREKVRLSCADEGVWHANILNCITPSHMIYLSLLVLLTAATLAAAPPLSVDFSGQYTRAYPLEAGQTVEISVGLPSPSKLPANGRVAVEWAGYRKVLHALDPDFYLVYRAPKSGQLTLKVSAVEDEEPIFNLPRWREAGSIQKIERFPKLTPWPAGHRLPLRVHVTPVQFGTSTRGMTIEAEPNDSIAEAQTDHASDSPARNENLHITGGADDIEYFDNGKVGVSGLDWFRIDFQGKEPRLFTANLTVPDPLVVSQVAVLHRRWQGVSRRSERQRARSSADRRTSHRDQPYCCSRAACTF